MILNSLNKETQTFLKELKQRPDVLAIILFGSWARGNNRPDSDVDLLVILEAGFKRTVEYRGDQAFEIIYTTEKSAVAFWESNKDDCARFWEVAQNQFDRDGMFKQLQMQAAEILKEGKQTLDNDQLNHLRFDAEDQLKYIKSILKSDLTTANMLLTNKVFMLTELFFDVRRLWTPAPKQRLSAIKAASPEFYHLLEKFYAAETPTVEKITLTHQIAQLVLATQV